MLVATILNNAGFRKTPSCGPLYAVGKGNAEIEHDGAEFRLQQPAVEARRSPPDFESPASKERWRRGPRRSFGEEATYSVSNTSRAHRRDEGSPPLSLPGRPLEPYYEMSVGQAGAEAAGKSSDVTEFAAYGRRFVVRAATTILPGNRLELSARQDNAYPGVWPVPLLRMIFLPAWPSSKQEAPTSTRSVVPSANRLAHDRWTPGSSFS